MTEPGATRASPRPWPSTWRTPKKAVKAGGTINAPPTPNSPDTMPPTIPSGTDQPQGSGSRSGWRKSQPSQEIIGKYAVVWRKIGGPERLVLGLVVAAVLGRI